MTADNTESIGRPAAGEDQHLEHSIGCNHCRHKGCADRGEQVQGKDRRPHGDAEHLSDLIITCDGDDRPDCPILKSL